MQRVIVAAALATAACARESGGGSAVTRDSAGITIVENIGPAWTAEQAWQVVDSAVVDIGGGTGDPAYELSQVRGPVRLRSGMLAIANATTNEVRIYDGSGKHVKTTGRGGTGPGEYQNITGLWLGPGDSLLVADVLVRRLTVLDHEGTVGRSFSLGGQGGALAPSNGRVELAIPIGWFGDGSVVGVSQAFAINQTRAGVFRDSQALIRYGSDGTVRDTLAVVPGIEMEQLTVTFGTRSFSTPTAVPLGKQTMTAVAADRFYVAQNKSWEIEMHGLDGALRTLVRTARQTTRITPSDIAANRKEQLDQMKSNPALRGVPDAIMKQVTDRIEQAKYPETFPFLGPLLADDTGNLWAQEVTSPVIKTQRFAVIDSTGRWLGTVTMPARFTPTAIAAGMVYGVWRDEDDVEHVRGYRLRKP